MHARAERIRHYMGQSGHKLYAASFRNSNPLHRLTPHVIPLGCLPLQVFREHFFDGKYLLFSLLSLSSWQISFVFDLAKGRVSGRDPAEHLRRSQSFKAVLDGWEQSEEPFSSG